MQVVTEHWADDSVDSALSQAKIGSATGADRVTEVASDREAILLPELERVIEANRDPPVARVDIKLDLSRDVSKRAAGARIARQDFHQLVAVNEIVGITD